MGRYLVTVCEEGVCTEVGRANTVDGAKRKAVKAARKRAKRWKGIPAPEGEVKASVYPVDKGIVQDDPVYEAKESYGTPKRKGKRRQRPAAPPPAASDPWDT